MNIQIICVGKLKEKYWTDAVSEYMKRLFALLQHGDCRAEGGETSGQGLARRRGGGKD